MAKNRLMTHLVAGFPTIEDSEKAAIAMVEGGAAYLEVQFPFSDPVADGPIIQRACSQSLDNGFTLDDGFSLVKKLVEKGNIPVFIMTYANIAVATGMEKFIQKTVGVGASGLIIPDLPYDYDEGLYELGKKYQLPIVPVMVPGISDFRLERIIGMKPEFIYTAVRKGITGTKSLIDDNTVVFLNRISRSGISIMAGFGIQEKSQVGLLAPHVHCAVVGSALVEVIIDSLAENEDFTHKLEKLVSCLSNSS